MKAIMYHYVRPFNERLPLLNHLHIDDFCKQLDYFQENFGFLSKEAFYNMLTSNQQPATSNQQIILTFDDGLSCHFHYVYPELKKRGLWGIFYVPTGVYQRNKLLDVHRTHIILATRDEQLVSEMLQSKISDEMLIDLHRETFQKETYGLQIDGEYSKLVKRILNYYIDYRFREQIIDELVQELDLNEFCQVEQFYLTHAQMQEMAQGGMLIGSHTVNHPVMSKLSKTEQIVEIKQSFDYLSPYIDPKWKTFCYPYGGKHSYTDETIEILHQENCLFSFDVNSTDITLNDIEQSIQTLPRYDCNEFPYGQVRRLQKIPINR